jgi:hypothetical protein
MKMSATGILDYSYDLLSIPLAIEVRYQTVFNSPLYLSAGMTAGTAFNQIDLREMGGDHWVVKAFVAPSFGIGLQFLSRFKIAISVSSPIIFFDNNPFVAVSPGIGVEYAFR